MEKSTIAMCRVVRNSSRGGKKGGKRCTNGIGGGWDRKRMLGGGGWVFLGVVGYGCFGLGLSGCLGVGSSIGGEFM